ncbi:MAG: tetratricopeptide repeat protein [Candidatus Thorarchaeota archaeon]
MIEQDKEKRKFLLELTSDAQSFIYLGKKEEALDCYDKILAKYPTEIAAIYGKGMTYFEFGDYDEAIKYFDQILSIKPDEIDTLYAKGALLNNLRQSEEALELLEKVTEIDSDYHIAWLAKGYALLDLERYQDSLESFEKAAAISDPSITYIGKGHAFRKLAQFEEAKKCYQAVINVDPYDAEGLFGLGMIEFTHNNLKKAIDLLSKSVIQDEQNLEAWETLAEAFKLTKDSVREKVAQDKIKELSKD